MKDVMIKGIKQLYVAKHEDVPMTIKEDDIPIWYIGGMPEFMQRYIRASNDVRAIVTLTYDQSAYVQYVYWYFQDVDLDELDKRIISNDVENIAAYFENTVVLHYQITNCNDGCKQRFYTLIMNRSSAYTADPSELNWKPFKDQHMQILHCPNCGKSFRQIVIKIMGEYIEDSDSSASPLSEDSEQTQSGFNAEEIFKTAFDEFFQNREPKDSD